MQAATREAKEEVGVDLSEKDLVFSTVLHRIEGDERVDFFVQVLQWPGEPFNAEPDKCDDLRWVEIDSLPANTVPYVRQALQNYLNGLHFDEYEL